MRYWDASAIVPVIVEEKSTRRIRTFLEEDDEASTWVMSRLEVVGAVERRAREGAIDLRLRQELLHRVHQFFRVFDEIVDVQAVVTQAMTLLARHALPSADAAQLAAALLVAEGDPGRIEFVCLDRALAEAAGREGFRILGV